MVVFIGTPYAPSSSALLPAPPPHLTTLSPLQRRPKPPREFIPSQMWAKHAVEDDPRLDVSYEQSVPLGQRR